MCNTGIGGVYNSGWGEFLGFMSCSFEAGGKASLAHSLILIATIGEADSLALIAVARIGMGLLLRLRIPLQSR